VDFKANTLFNEEVYVYTPKGDMKILPKGATALDFAFSIHTDIGYHCVSIKVNNKLAPLGYELQSGDQVQVLTSKNQKPSEDWDRLVVTGKAKAKIRSAMKEDRRRRGEIGKEALERKLKHLRVDFEEGVEVLLKFFGYSSRTDLYYDLAMGVKTIPELFKHFRTEGNKLVEFKPDASLPHSLEPPGPTEAIRDNGTRRPDQRPRLLINGEPAESYQFSIASCCNPVQGDDIFAYLTSNAGLKIHRTNCPNATNLMAHYGYRIMKAEWVFSDDMTFIADLRINGIDSGPGVIERVTHQISSQLGLDIRSLNIAGDEGYFEGMIKLKVRNINQLNQVIRALQGMDNVTSVVRVDY